MFQRRRTPPPYQQVKKQQSASSKKAAAAAAAVIVCTTDKKSNPNSGKKQHKTMILPKQLSDHAPKEMILRCAQRMAPYSLSVDTLLRLLRTLRSHPQTTKYHSIDTSSMVFQRSLHAPYVLDFLRAMNFWYSSSSRTKYNNRNSNINSNNSKILTLLQFDPALFYIGISALEQIQQTSTAYAKHKALRTFHKEIDTVCSVDATKAVHENELSERKHYLSKLPKEPCSRGSAITIEFVLPGVTTASTSGSIKADSGIANNHKNNTLQKITRAFDHDDTLNDVVNWLGGHIHSAIPKKLRTSTWHLVARNRRAGSDDTDDAFQYSRWDVTTLSDQTLYSLGRWPSARITIVPNLTLPSSPAMIPIKNSSIVPNIQNK